MAIENQISTEEITFSKLAQVPANIPSKAKEMMKKCFLNILFRHFWLKIVMITKQISTMEFFLLDLFTTRIEDKIKKIMSL